MYKAESTLPLIVASVDNHVAAAERHEKATESHRNAAAYYTDGEYQQGEEQARLAKGYGRQAEEHCARAMK